LDERILTCRGPRWWVTGWQFVRIALLLFVGCSWMAPRGILGLVWGEDAIQAAVRLGLHCEHWEPWEGGQGFEACFDTERRVAIFGAEALGRLFRREGRLEGISLRFPGCGSHRDALREAVRREFKLKSDSPGEPYHVWWNHALVHLGYDSTDDTCTLTLAGPRLGKVFEGYLMAQGLGDLSRGLRPSH
jgi:hypothetical protein